MQGEEAEVVTDFCLLSLFPLLIFPKYITKKVLIVKVNWLIVNNTTKLGLGNSKRIWRVEYHGISATM